MQKAIEERSQLGRVGTKTMLQNRIWRPALIVTTGWIVGNIISFVIADWLMAGSGGIEFEPRVGAALFMGILGLLAGFSMSIAFWFSQDNFIGIHAFAYTFIVAIFMASIVLLPSGLYILPLLFAGLFIGMKWAKPAIEFWNILASFIIWITVAAVMGLAVVTIVSASENTLIQLFWQCVWSGTVSFLSGAFMFWQLRMPSSPEIISSEGQEKTGYHDLQRIYNPW